MVLWWDASWHHRLVLEDRTTLWVLALQLLAAAWVSRVAAGAMDVVAHCSVVVARLANRAAPMVLAFAVQALAAAWAGPVDNGPMVAAVL